MILGSVHLCSTEKEKIMMTVGNDDEDEDGCGDDFTLSLTSMSVKLLQKWEKILSARSTKNPDYENDDDEYQDKWK